MTPCILNFMTEYYSEIISYRIYFGGGVCIFSFIVAYRLVKTKKNNLNLKVQY